jgi:probable rRNA maturation factor
MSSLCSSTSTIRRGFVLPEKLVCLLKSELLDENYDLSVVFVGEKRAKTLNKKFRNKSYTPNVLSFPLDTEQGEIFICPSVIGKEAKAAGINIEEHTLYMYIHGLLHLAGHDHGKKMEDMEKKLLTKYTSLL